MDFPDAVSMILALLFFTAFLLIPSPVVSDATGLGTSDPGQTQQAPSRDLSSIFTGVEERFRDGHFLNPTPVSVPGAAGSTVTPDGNETALRTEKITPPVPKYDDDELMQLVEESSASLLLSLQNSYALYVWDESLVKESAAELRTFATSLLEEVEALDVSGKCDVLKTSFIRALESYRTAGTVLRGNTPLNSTMVDIALDANRMGSHHLREAFEYLQCPVQRVPEEIVAIDLSSSLLYAKPGIRDELELMQRYVYMDRSRANEISLMLESVKRIDTIYYLDGSGNKIEAEPGRMFLLVKVRVTNLGHIGEGRMYRIQTPDLRDFALQYRGTTYSPMKLPTRTSLGESYATVTLDRYKVKTGYIVFDVPEALTLDECSIQVKLPDASPVWALGKTP
ncbi:MAG: hypothetical protein ACOX7V_02860 [Methanoculleus thermophilus]